jgi:ribose-phosphate pyrophosphokinase
VPTDVLLPGSTSQALAAELARETGERLLQPTFDRFPDGELLAAVDPDDASRLDGGRAVVVAATATSDAHLELLQLQDAARESGAREVVTVLPYMGYARQDEAFKPGQPVSARAVARAISTGTDRIVLVNPHEPTIADAFDVACETVDAAPLLADPLPTLDDPLFLAPDEGAIDLAVTVRDAHGAGATDYFAKERDYDTGEVSVEPNDAPVADRDIVLVDDIVATGSTMSESVGVLRERGAGRVFVTCVHPLLATNARTKLEAAGVASIVGTDTLERDASRVSVAPVVADVL